MIVAAGLLSIQDIPWGSADGKPVISSGLI
jgi:hypothetical protein